MPLYLPVREGGDVVVGLTGLLAPGDAEGDVEELRGQLIEGVIEESEDESLMDRYLGGEEIDEKVLIADLERAVARATFFPVVPVCSLTGIGCTELLDLATRAFPSPSEHPSPQVFTPAGRRRRRDHLRPRRPAGGRGREDHQRPVRRSAQPGPRLLRDAAAGRVGARLRATSRRSSAPMPATRTTTRTRRSAR